MFHLSINEYVNRVISRAVDAKNEKLEGELEISAISKFKVFNGYSKW